MTTIADLAVDVLKLIFRRYEAIELWKCGSKQLMAKLANGGASDISLSDPHSTSRSRFPKCLLSFSKMKSLRIKRHSHRLMEAEQLSPLLQQLPPTLEKLELEFKNVEDSFELIANEGFFDVFGEEECEPQPALTYLSRNWSLKETFPVLKTLILDDWYASETKWTKHEISDLPASLTSLRLPCMSGIPYNAYQFLPAGLQILDVSAGSAMLSDSLFEHLPRNLTNLKTPSIGLYMESLIKIPQSVTNITCYMPSWTIELSTHFPNFVTLCTSTIDPSSRVLKTSVFGDDWAYIDNIFVSALPKSLTHFATSTIPRVGLLFSSLRYLPSTLVTLDLHSILWGEETPKDTLHAFPLLESLSLAMVSPEVLMHLPPTLTALYVKKSDIVEFEIAIFASKLPRTLTYLQMSQIYTWSSDAIKALPRALRAFEVPYSHVMAAGFAQLPPFLRSISLGYLIEHAIPRCIGNSDYYLAFDQSDEMEEFQCYESAPEDQFEDTDENDGFGLFGDGAPPNLVTRLRPKRKRREIVLPTAPQTLKTLQIKSYHHYDTNLLIASLPPNLTELVIPFICSGFPRLPQGLKVLRTKLERFSSEDFASLPKSLTVFDFGFMYSDDLPRDLTSFMPPNIDAFASGNGLKRLAEECYSKASHFRAAPLSTPDPRVLQRYRQYMES